jgi:hypothetical protein
MKVKEFRMLVHGPFATNIYLDLGELEELKRLSLTKTEIESLKNLKNKSRTEKKINGWPWKSKDSSTQQQQQENLDDINNLKSQGFVEYQKLNVAEIFLRYIWNKITGKVDSEESRKLSPTTYGLDEFRRIEEFEKTKNVILFNFIVK